MHLRHLAMLFAAVLLAAPVAALRAQSPAPAADVPASTRAGVFTAQQAARGRNVYAGMCSSCHSTSTHSGAAFFNRWGGQPIAELYSLISETMPQMDPASLSPQEYTDVVTYLLQINKMPAGERELPTDVAIMRKIRIDSAAAPGGSPQRRED